MKQEFYMKIGYARVSTSEQNLQLQENALEKFGCDKVFTDQISGKTEERYGLNQLLNALRSGDTVVVWRLDRLARSLKHLIEIVLELEKREVSLVSITENIDTSSPGGRLVFHIFGSIAQFELEIIRQRTLAGLEAAKERGRLGGRPTKLTSDKKSIIKQLMQNKDVCAGDIAKIIGVSRSSVYRYLDKENKN